MLSHEYIGQVIDPKTKVISYVSGSAKTKAEIKEWFESKPKFQGLTLVMKKRSLWNGKPFYFPKDKLVIIINLILLTVLMWKLAR
jgi:hypothetical protein